MPTTARGFEYPESTDAVRVWEDVEALADSVDSYLDGRLPARIATDTETSNGSAITTTETEVQAVTAALVTGRTYKIVWAFGFHVSAVASTDHFFGRIREDNVSGTQIQGRRLSATTTAQNYGEVMEAEYTAGSTGNKTFSASLQRSGTNGTVTLAGSATTPSRLYVEYVSG